MRAKYIVSTKTLLLIGVDRLQIKRLLFLDNYKILNAQGRWLK